MSNLTDAERAKLLGMSLDQFHRQISSDPDEALREHLAKNKSDAGSEYEDTYGDEFGAIVPKGMPSETDIFDENNIKIHWTKCPETDSEKAIFYGFHIHSKDNPYGLHTHVPGGQLLGAHKHGPGTKLGHHTHAIDTRNMPDSFLISPNSPVYLDGEHGHGELHPDGGHRHAPNTFG